MAWGRNDLERSEPLPLPQRHIDLAARRGQRRVGEAPPDLGHRLGVVGVIVGEGDPSQPPAARKLGGERRHVFGQRGAGVDQPRGLAADDPRVRSRQRERPRIVRADAQHVVVGLVDAGGHQRMISG